VARAHAPEVQRAMNQMVDEKVTCKNWESLFLFVVVIVEVEKDSTYLSFKNRTSVLSYCSVQNYSPACGRHMRQELSAFTEVENMN